MLHAARENGMKRVLFAFSACIYPQYLYREPDVVPLREEDAFPAEPEEGCGLEKLYMKKLCWYFTEDWGFATRVVRFHNVDGPLGTQDGGREKAPAAICRKVAMLADKSDIEIWGGREANAIFHVYRGVRVARAAAVRRDGGRIVPAVGDALADRSRQAEQAQDLFSIRNWLIWLDIYILLQTVSAVLGTKRAR
jgi:nucleoside-diphosphate-sugar epimerase